MEVENYSHVMHIVSNVTGTLRDDCDAFDALRATFPAGTVSGAPKIRAMEIIRELEPAARGPYAGTVGYVGVDGAMDMCITIRTFVIAERPRLPAVGRRHRRRLATPSASTRSACTRSRALHHALELAAGMCGRTRRGGDRMILVIDNYDSFTYNLVQLLAALGAEVRVERNDEVSPGAGRSRWRPRGIVVSPGPGVPSRGRRERGRHRRGRRGRASPSSACASGIRRSPRCSAATVVRAPAPDPRQDRRRAPRRRGRARGHAAAVHRDALPLARRRRATPCPTCLEVTARTDDGLVMALRHRDAARLRRAVPSRERADARGRRHPRELPQARRRDRPAEEPEPRRRPLGAASTPRAPPDVVRGAISRAVAGRVAARGRGVRGHGRDHGRRGDRRADRRRSSPPCA